MRQQEFRTRLVMGWHDMLHILTIALRRIRRLVPLVASVGLLCAAPVHSADLVAYTEEWAPYNFTEGEAIKGISTDILRAMCIDAKLECEINMVPWARAYRSALSTANTLVYTAARKPVREHEFLWVGPILPRTTWVYARAGQEKPIREFSDLTGRRVGVVREEAAQQDLIAAGVPESALVLQSSNADVLRMLLGATVDAMVDTEVGMQWNLRHAGVAPNAVSRLMKLSDEGAYYFALNLKTDPKLVRKLETALDKLRHDGKIDAIVRKYAALPATTSPAKK